MTRWTQREAQSNSFKKNQEIGLHRIILIAFVCKKVFLLMIFNISALAGMLL